MRKIQMTTKTRKAAAKATASKQRRAKVCTLEEAATLDFEPWPRDIDFEMLLTNEKFTELGHSNLITCRLALAIMHKTKAELIEIFTGLGEATACNLVEDIESAQKFFSAFFELLDSAHARLIVTGASYTEAA